MKNTAVTAIALAWIGGHVLMNAPEIPDARRLASFIPAAAGPWLSEADQTFDARSIFNYIDGAGEVYRSYNMSLLVARRFHKDGKPDIVVDAFDMGSAKDAFGVFTHDLEGEDAAIGQGSNYKAGLLLFWKDRYFLSVYAEEETAETKGLVLELGRRIAAGIPAEGPKPALLGSLPAESLDASRIRFFHNHSVLNYHFFVADMNILRLDQTTDAVLATYGDGGDLRRLLVVAYANAAAAAAAAGSFRKAYMPEVRGRNAVKTENGRWTVVRVEANIVAIAFDAPSEPAGVALVNAVAVRTDEGAGASGEKLGPRSTGGGGS